MSHLIAEFKKQSFTQIIFPHKKTDWVCCLKEAQNTFVNIINEIIKFQKCLVICADIQTVKCLFKEDKNLYFLEYETNDTWARDNSALCVESNGEVVLLNFTFNGWGEKFDAKKDDAMSKSISKYYSQKMMDIDFVLEGGGVESNGKNLLLTTSKCMLNKNRNKNLNEVEISKRLKNYFGVNDVLYLNHGYLAGDDTDSHIDTLARFVDESTIMYVRCEDKNDEHYTELKLMEDELKIYAKKYSLKLIPLPMPKAIYFEDKRVPATYANFLFVNGAVLVPVYNVKEDKEVIEIFKKTFKDREIVTIDSSTLIKQHGSLHCVTMNFAEGVTLLV